GAVIWFFWPRKPEEGSGVGPPDEGPGDEELLQAQLSPQQAPQASQAYQQAQLPPQAYQQAQLPPQPRTASQEAQLPPQAYQQAQPSYQQSQQAQPLRGYLSSPPMSPSSSPR